ncbi:RagB/SusD family nutrient uptake outer membrane protein [Pedobacter sp. MC2016-24]|uniref:RagB/SusD family nutrient uptake outer membrane protein n=1 Tax=Pedobacter sp. MC2016-24 TaxID=2780090 RepID=UPI001880779F|nr:RagB/SusD family nutrient uptake outer membrane protein [Pedobacter sp. MC2016-24]MBE9597851.1 RagB/SusD family nutrient uptake outer membrane protein [Pedobacter sp. MC2016-24]
MNTKYLNFSIAAAIIISLISCQKYLDVKPDKKLAVPSKLEDFQSLLDNYSVFAAEPNSGEMSSDDFYLTSAHYLSLSSDVDRRTYTWEKDYLFRPEDNSWREFSTAVYYCNSVIEGIEKVKRSNSNNTEWDNIKGQAYYFRGKRLLQASFIWALAYDRSTSDTDLGLPLRLNINFNEPSVRSSVERTYQQILNDLKVSIHLLPLIPLSKVRASKPAAYAMVARAYLSMQDYNNAVLYADSCLRLYHTLLDYNSLNSASPLPIDRFNREVISENQISVGQILNLARAKVNPELLALYDNENDLRKAILFKDNGDGTAGYKARFTEGASLFAGTAVNEVYLTRAECYARAGKLSEAMKDLNTLLVARWRAGTFVPFTASSKEEALSIILKERRKELLFRDIRWMDIKRLNKEGAEILLMRNVNNKEYKLLPNDLRYALPIPEDVISISGMEQNKR